MRWTPNDTAAFMATSAVGGKLVDAYEKRRFEAGLQDLMKETPSQSFSEEQGQGLEALSRKTTTDENGIEVPAYELSSDGTNYTATAKAGTGLSDVVIRPERHKMFDATQDKPFSEDQVRDLRAQKAADYYMSQGRPEDAMGLQAKRLALRDAQRQDEVGQKQQGLDLATLDHKYATLKDSLKADVAAKKLSIEQARQALFKTWWDAVVSMPAYANRMLQDPETQQFMGIKDASYDKASGMVVLTDTAGNQHKITKEQGDAFARGGPSPVKITTLAEGAKAIATDDRGRVKEVASNPKAPDPTKNDAQQDDAAGVMTKLLDVNKTMMTQFGGKETAMREKMVLLHLQNIGQFKRENGRAPTLEEAAKIAKQVFDVVSQQASK